MGSLFLLSILWEVDWHLFLICWLPQNYTTMFLSLSLFQFFFCLLSFTHTVWYFNGTACFFIVLIVQMLELLNPRSRIMKKWRRIQEERSKSTASLLEGHGKPLSTRYPVFITSIFTFLQLLVLVTFIFRFFYFYFYFTFMLITLVHFILWYLVSPPICSS